MPTAEAHVTTDRPSRYLVQVCKHFSNKGSHLKGRPRNHHGDGEGAGVRHEPLDIDPTQITVEWSATLGTVTLPWGRCELRAVDGDLVLQVDADTEENLRKLQNLLTMHLGRFGRRDQLHVEWDRTGTPPPSAPRPASAQRSHLAWAGLAVTVVAVHLGLADVVLSARDWTSWAVGAVLVVIAAKLAAVLIVGRRFHRGSRRRA